MMADNIENVRLYGA